MNSTKFATFAKTNVHKKISATQNRKQMHSLNYNVKKFGEANLAEVEEAVVGVGDIPVRQYYRGKLSHGNHNQTSFSSQRLLRIAHVQWTACMRHNNG